jgi:thiaminase/transcriptional activator TenA
MTASTRTGRIHRLLEDNASALNNAAAQPLLKQMSAGTISVAAFSNYMTIEGRFVHTAARAIGYCAWQSPTWTQLSGFTNMLTSLVADQSDHFATTQTSISSLPAGADALAQVIEDAIASDGYPAVATCLCAAETLYLQWCSAAVAIRSPQTIGLAWDWIELHTQPAFVAGVRFLQDAVDQLDPNYTDAALDRWFERMLAAENTFHAAAIEGHMP